MPAGLDALNKLIFTLLSIVLMVLAAALIVYALVRVIVTVSAGAPLDEVGSLLLSSVSYVVIAIAIFDAAKYLVEEEVVRGREMRHAGEARRSLTKFISTIAIAVMLEALVAVAEAAKDDLREMIYPTVLLLSGIVLVVGLGLYQRLSATVEVKLGGEEGERADEAAAGTHR